MMMQSVRGDCVRLGGILGKSKRDRKSVVAVVCKVAVKERGAVLCKRIQGHQAAVTAGIVVSSTPGVHRIATASLDKTVAFWEIHEDAQLEAAKVRTCRISLHGGPAFSLLSDTERAVQGKPSVFCGTAKAGLVIWDPLKEKSVSRVINPPHSGWVRALDSHGKWIVSCDCNNLRLMDLSWTVPRQVDTKSLFTGDILDVSIQGKTIFASATNGSIYRWEIAPGGNLHESGSVLDAHDGRVTAVVHYKNMVYTTGYDGMLKMWDATTLECLAVVSNAHSGKINAATMGSDGLLHTGGDDGLINRWRPKTLSLYGHPLVSHRDPIRVLSMGKGCTLISGDASGLISVWDLDTQELDE